METQRRESNGQKKEALGKKTIFHLLLLRCKNGFKYAALVGIMALLFKWA
jgi:hypothetical protein